MKKVFTIFVSLLILVEIFLVAITIFVNFEEGPELEEPYFLDQADLKIDTLIAQMSLNEKIGQLFFLELNAASSEDKEKLDSLNQQYFFCGIKFKKTEVLNQLLITNYLQSRSKFPLLIGSEGDIVNRSDFNLPLGAIINAVPDSLFTLHYLQNYAEVLKLEGVSIDFSNSLDVLDSMNTQLGFSDNAVTVAEQTKKIRKILHSHKIISCLNYADELFFNPDSIAVDTLARGKQNCNINRYFAMQITPDVVNKIALRIAPYHLDDFNKKYYGFKGLIFCELTDTFATESYKRFFDSGSDVFVINNDIEKHISTIKRLVENKQISDNEINSRVKRVLLAKKWAQIEPPVFKSAEISLSKILSNNRMLLSWELYKNSFSLIKNRNSILPFGNLLNKRTHLLVLGHDKLPYFEENLSFYLDFSHSQYVKGKLNMASLLNAQNVIVAVSNEQGLFSDSSVIKSLQAINKTRNLIVINFGDAANIKKLAFADVLIHVYSTHPFAQAVTAQSIAGAVQPRGKILPLTLAEGLDAPRFQKYERFEYTPPEAAGFDSYKLKAIDSLIEWAIAVGAMPGCEVLAAKNGKVFYYKAFGYHTYSKIRRVQKSDIYDLASITKVAATTLAAMKLFEIDSIHLEDSIKYYMDDTLNCTIKNHHLSDFFVHQTGLPADMPILQYISYRDSVTGRYDKYYTEKKDSLHTIKVADNYYFRTDCLDSIIDTLYRLEIDTTKPYLYSDINFNIIYDVLKRKIKGPYKQFIYSNFYKPLQLRTMGYMPIERFDKYRIAPTQFDRYWRKELLQGTPHDESAAIYGGISGNAGLFSNANDLAILFQMLINGGVYGGAKVLNSETIERFTSTQENSSRGLGFNRKNGGLFGHSGFTGCVVWANPQNKFIYVFLSNSIHPKATNKKLNKYKIRSNVYDLIWAAYRPGSGELKLSDDD